MKLQPLGDRVVVKAKEENDTADSFRPGDSRHRQGKAAIWPGLRPLARAHSMKMAIACPWM